MNRILFVQMLQNGLNMFAATNASPERKMHQVLDQASMLVVRKVENVAVGTGSKPRLGVVIAECGEL